MVDIKVTGNDELAELARNTNQMKNTMHQLMENIGLSASQVAAGAKNISDSGNMLAQGATTQAASVEQLSASIAEITNQTAQNAENAERANRLTGEANGKAEIGNKRIGMPWYPAQNMTNDEIYIMEKVIIPALKQQKPFELPATIKVTKNLYVAMCRLLSRMEYDDNDI